MLISEVLSNDSGGSGELRKIERLVLQVENDCPMLSKNAVDELQEALLGLKFELSQEQKLHLWKLSYRIWNTCVGLQERDRVSENHAKLRNVASDMLLTAGSISSIKSCLLKMAMFFYKTGITWQKIPNHLSAESCFQKATEIACTTREDITTQSKEDQQLLFDLCVARSKSAWELSHISQASSLLTSARSFLFESIERHRELADVYLHYGKLLLSKEEIESKAKSVEYMEQALEICCRALNYCSEDAAVAAVNNQKLTIIRYLAASQLQNGNFNAVLKWVSILKGVSDHASTPYLALKAFLGLNRFEDAENQLMTLVGSDKADMDVCMTSLLFMIQQQHLSSVAKAFLILHSRFPTDTEASFKILENILNLKNSSSAVEAALTIATDEYVLKAFTATSTAAASSASSSSSSAAVLHSTDGRICVHSLLWNSGNEYFEAKDYVKSIKLFEASMLYIPKDSEKGLRAKALRVLSLCHLGLSQYDRAAEYVDGAYKIEPNIACSFLKFKIYLQLNDEERATKEVENMRRCSDFEAEYMMLASHEATACNKIQVAIFALSTMLSQVTGTSREYGIFRNILSLVMKDSATFADEGIRYLKKAKARFGDNRFASSYGDKESNWLAGCAWNLGLDAARSRKFKKCADFFACASDFYSLLPDSVENLQRSETCLLIAVAASFAEGDDELAAAYLDTCRKVHEAVKKKSMKVSDVMVGYLKGLEFESKVRKKDYKGQMDMIRESSCLDAENIMSMGMRAGSRQVSIAAFRASLDKMMRCVDVDYRKVLMMMRKMMMMMMMDGDGDDDDEVDEMMMKMYEEVNGVIDNGSESVRNEEVEWFVCSAWNRGVVKVRKCEWVLAEKWMRVALNLCHHSSSSSSSSSNKLGMMTSTLQQVINLKQQHDNAFVLEE